MYVHFINIIHTYNNSSTSFNYIYEEKVEPTHLEHDMGVGRTANSKMWQLRSLQRMCSELKTSVFYLD